MRLIFGLMVCLCIFSGTALCQEQMTKMMAGPSGDTFRVLVSFIAITDDTYNMQSMIIDVDPVKNNTQTPTSYYADLTATVRSMETGEKKQRILVLRWGRSGEVEVKCEGGKWARQTTGPELDKIVETIKAVIQNAPLDTKKAIEFTLPKAVGQNVIAVLNGLETSKLICVRAGN